MKLVIRGRYPDLRSIVKAGDLLPVISDRLRLVVLQDGKLKGGKLSPSLLGHHLHAEAFLQRFLPLDRDLPDPLYLPSWDLTRPGYNDGGRGQRFYYAGHVVPSRPCPDTIRRFLDAMPFKSNADRTNAVAAALTVVLRNHWPGAKPWFPVTANKSHAGKGTVVDFIAGAVPVAQVSYEATDWAFQKAVEGVLRHVADLGVLNLDNIRLDRRGDVIRSLFLERMLHEPVLLLSSAGTTPTRMPFHFVVVATCNHGQFSIDLLNRAVLIRLEATGDPARRASPIGDPKLDFLPNNRSTISAELRGMVERWKAEGRPLDESARHPSFKSWAQTVGGILKVNGFTSFLANQAERRTDEDPVRRGLALLGRSYPGDWARTADWANRIAILGLIKTLLPGTYQDGSEARLQGVGKVFSAHTGETLVADSEDEQVTVVLQKARRRFEGGEASTRNRFDVVSREAVPEDATN